MESMLLLMHTHARALMVRQITFFPHAPIPHTAEGKEKRKDWHWVAFKKCTPLSPPIEAYLLLIRPFTLSFVHVGEFRSFWLHLVRTASAVVYVVSRSIVVT